MSCCGSCAAGGPCEPSRPTSPTYLAVCADPSMVFTRDAVGRQVCARPGSGPMPSDHQRPTYVASCLPGYHWEDRGPVNREARLKKLEAYYAAGQLTAVEYHHRRREILYEGPVCVPDNPQGPSAPTPAPIPNTVPQGSASSWAFSAVRFPNSTAPMTAALMNCAPLPWTAASADAVARLVRTHVLANQTDAERLTLTGLLELYPVTRENVPIDWANLPASAAVCLLELRRLVRAKVDQVLAELALQAAQQRYRAAAGGAG